MIEVQRFVSFAGCSAAKVFIDAILGRMTTKSTIRFLTKLEIAILGRNETFSKVTAGFLFPQLFLKFFSQSANNSISKTEFSNKMSAFLQEDADGFPVTVAMLEHHHLLLD